MESFEFHLGKMLAPKEVAERLNCAEKTVYNLVAAGRLPRISLSSVDGCSRALRIPEKAVDAFIKNDMKRFLVDMGICDYCGGKK